jgi:hypothetical protein
MCKRRGTRLVTPQSLKGRGSENLVVLAYASNPCYTDLFKLSDLEKKSKDIEIDPKDLEIDFKDKIWSFNVWSGRIGEGRKDLGIYNRDYRGIIGVYDHSNYDHVWNLVHDAQEALKTSGSMLED